MMLLPNFGNLPVTIVFRVQIVFRDQIEKLKLSLYYVVAEIRQPSGRTEILMLVKYVAERKSLVSQK